ncbi:MAG: LysR family transcriptional regulator [Steroidobacteraceae bacterium]
MAKGNHPVYVQMRVDFGSGASVGPGKVALLERISAVGSLSQAARDLGLSYRRAWLLLDDLNHAFGEPVVITATGGSGGGGARLTPLGLDLIERYRRVEGAMEKVVVQEFRGLAAKSAGARVSSAVPRRPLSRRLKSAAS